MLLPFSAHLGYLFTELPLERRFEAAASAGFQAVEHPAPFEIPPQRMKSLLLENQLGLAQITSGMGLPGEKGIACLPGREAEFRDGYARALDYAEEVGCPFVHPMAGVGGERDCYRANLDVAIRLCEDRKPEVLVEAISATAVPGYHMCHIDDLLQLAGGTDGRVRVLIDTFHASADGHVPSDVIRRAGRLLGHVHVADFPGRNEPGTGSLDFGPVLDALVAIGFSGAIGFEYQPSGPGHLSWLGEWRKRLAYSS